MKLTVVRGDLIPFDELDVLNSVGISAEHRFADTIRDLLEKTKDLAEPKAFYLECPVKIVSERSVAVGDAVFHSEMLVKMVQDTKVVYPFLCTCGEELARFGETLTDITEKFAFDAIMDFYRKVATLRLSDHVLNLLPEGQVVATLYPGDVATWEVRELKKLFELFGENAAKLGVSLNDYYMMSPLKTVAGLFYGVKEAISECAVCNKENCSLRTEPFDENAYLRTLYRV